MNTKAVSATAAIPNSESVIELPQPLVAAWLNPYTNAKRPPEEAKTPGMS